MENRQRTVRGTLANDRGTWVVRGRVYDPTTGKTHQKSKSTGFKVKNCTKRKAEKAMRVIVASWEQEANAGSISYGPDFAEYVQKWLEKKSFSLKANSVKSYQDYADTHILPELGRIKVNQMTLRDLQSYYIEKMICSP